MVWVDLNVSRERRSELRLVFGFARRNYPGGDSAVVPPDPMPNSEVKRRDADGSVGVPHVRVGHRQGFIVIDIENRMDVGNRIDKRP